MLKVRDDVGAGVAGEYASSIQPYFKAIAASYLVPIESGVPGLKKLPRCRIRDFTLILTYGGVKVL